MSHKAVLLKTGLTPLNTVRPVNTAHPKTAVHSAKSKTHFSKQAQSTAKRPFYKQTALTRRSVHAAKRHFYTGRHNAVNTARSYTGQVNVVRGKPQHDDKGFVDSGCSRHMTGNIAYLFDFKEFEGRICYIKMAPLKKVGDEAVHKELGDRMERAATTASSLEAEQVSGDVDAQTRFKITSKQSIDPPLLRGYTLRSGEDINDAVKRMLIAAVQFRYSGRKQRKEAETAHAETGEEEHFNTPFNDPLPSGEDSMQLNELMVLCTKLQQQVLNLEKAKSDQAIEIASLKKREECILIGRIIKDIDAGCESASHSMRSNDQGTKLDDSTCCEAITTTSVKDSAAPTIQVSTAGIGELEEEHKLARKQEEEANIALIESWENTQAMMEADRLLAERLQLKEREELTDEEKGKLFMELMEKRRKHFAALKAQEKRNNLTTKSKENFQMSTYLSNDEVLRDKNNRKTPTETKREARKKESEEVDEAELKKLLVIKKDEDIAIDAIPLAIKLPVIVNYKLHKEGMLVHYQLIRADGSSKRYSSMIRMLQGIDREDLEALWRIVKAKYGDTRPED
ncbi:hypothetical protein Tco_1158486 [Tanacetum coccineum]